MALFGLSYMWDTPMASWKRTKILLKNNRGQTNYKNVNRWSALTEMESITNNKTLLKYLKHVSNFQYTGWLEVWHYLINKYCMMHKKPPSFISWDDCINPPSCTIAA